MSCDLCNSESFYFVYQLLKGYKIYVCKNCGLRFLYPVHSKNDLKKIYKEDYFESWGVNYGDKKSLKKLKELSYESIFREVERFIAPGRFLDVGCAFGYSFGIGIQRGWDPYGVEISPEAFRVASEKFFSKVSLGDFLNIELNKNFFDLVIMFDFLEHTDSLTAAMSKAHIILKPKGLIAIVTPDINSFSARLMRKKWLHIKLEHTFYLSPRTLKLLFIKTGFKPVLFKSFWKSINFLYLKSQIEKYGSQYQFLILKSIERFIPSWIRQFNIFIPQGEILALAIKDSNNL